VNTTGRKTPVVVVGCRLAALAIMRTLGSAGVPVYGVDADPGAPALKSRYCRERIILPLDEARPAAFVEGLLALGRRLGKAVLIPTSDETTQVVANHARELSEFFIFQNNSPALIHQLTSKREMFSLAMTHNVPTPATIFPTSVEDVESYARTGAFPVMLKGIFGNRLELRTRKKMVIVENPEDLVKIYAEMEDPESPNLMLQEYIPGGDDTIFIFNGYFNAESDCLVGFTGYKLRQFPVHVGCASLGECRWVEDVAATTIRFMKAVGYKGILDIGYRFDARDGQYKVLDINPRVGQAFRLFTATNDHDVVKALYLDFTGQPQPPARCRDGRRWMIEDFDFISSYHYYCEGTLGLRSWLRSLQGVEEAAWFDLRDPLPFLSMVGAMTKRVLNWALKRTNPGTRPTDERQSGTASTRLGTMAEERGAVTGRRK
jgi:D-aspartate ligase